MLFNLPEWVTALQWENFPQWTIPVGAVISALASLKYIGKALTWSMLKYDTWQKKRGLLSIASPEGSGALPKISQISIEMVENLRKDLTDQLEELREDRERQAEKLRADLQSVRTDLDQWRHKYYTLYEQTLDMRGIHLEAEKKYRTLEARYAALHTEFEEFKKKQETALGAAAAGAAGAAAVVQAAGEAAAAAAASVLADSLSADEPESAAGTKAGAAAQLIDEALAHVPSGPMPVPMPADPTLK